MKNKLTTKFMKGAAPLLVLLSTLNPQLSTAHAQGTAFTYQGWLNNGSSPANGSYDLTFTLFGVSGGGSTLVGPVTNSAVGVTNGLFITLIDFGDAFTGTSNWLEIAARTNGTGGFTTLTPRQQLTSVPYAIYAENAGNLLGTLSASQLTSVGNGNGGTSNFFVGPSGNVATTGSWNTADGVGALSADTIGYGNTANGFDALFANTSGNQNTANGNAALSANTTGSENTALGDHALYFNTTGWDNTALGNHALTLDTTGSRNTAEGSGALTSNTTGSNNIALGYQAGYFITTGGSNIDIGNQGFSSDTNIIRIGSGQSQTFIAGVIHGDGGGLTNLSASQLTSIGNDSGSSNFFVGPSGNATTTGHWNTANGFSALASTTTGTGNTANGYDAAHDTTTGYYNTANGYAALKDNTDGIYNTANGAEALALNTTGSWNTANGAGALSHTATGNFNTADGFNALDSSTAGSYNIALGYLAGLNITTGSNNIDIGNQGLATDTNIIRIGSGQSQTFIAGNVGLGSLANNPVAQLEVTSSGLISQPQLRLDQTVSGEYARLRFKSVTNGVWDVAVGGGSANTMNFFTGSPTGLPGTNVLILNPNGNATLFGALTQGSDRARKENFRTIDPQTVLAKVAALPITTWNYRSAPEASHLGPMAQDFHSAFGLNGTDDKGIAIVDENGVALAAIQGLNQKLDEKDVEIQKLKEKAGKVDSLEKRLNELEQMVQSLAANK